MSPGFRQEVFNVLLAQLLQERGVVTAPESIIKATADRASRMPDVIVSFYGLRTAIEGEVGGQPDAEVKAIDAARRRVQEGIAHIGVAVVYPQELRDLEFARLKEDLSLAQLHMAVVTESEETGFASGTVDYLENALRSAFDQLVKEDVVARAVAELDSGIERFAAELIYSPGVVGRLANTLGIRDLPVSIDPPEAGTGGRPRLSPEHMYAVSRIAGLVLLNAMIFQDILAQRDTRVQGADTIAKRIRPVSDFVDHWEFILEKINYYPIFHVARECLLDFVADPGLTRAIRDLADRALSIVGNRAALRHDLMGRVYHRLLAEKKFLATYYTSIPSAALLLKLTLRQGAWDVDWHEIDKVRQLRIADLACGTGTLLMAAADCLADNYIAASAERARNVDSPALHAALAEDVLYGYDVLPSALHLTASTLALKSPDVTFKGMNLFSLPLGGEHHRLGSLEFLGGDSVGLDLWLFGTPTGIEHVSSHGADDQAVASPPKMDLCVMNPPFTRSVGGNLLFGPGPRKERADMQKKLKELVKTSGAFASITAGLGSVFVAIADRYLKPGGRMALVLPKAALSGVAWDKTRELFRGKYRLEYVVASHDPLRWNFSESTDLSEVLLVVAKLENGPGRADDPPVIGVNLWQNPTTSFDALAVASDVLRGRPPDIATGQGGLQVGVGRIKMGEAVSIPWESLRGQYSWLLPCAFAQADMIRAAYYLIQHRLWRPGHRDLTPLPLCRLGDLATVGPDRRDIHDAFSLSSSQTAYPAYWGHDARTALTMAQKPNMHLSPLPQALEGRHLRRVEDLWPHAGRLLIAERLWLKTQRLAAMRLSKPVLSNVWWPVRLTEKRDTDRYAKPLVLWLNSTLGMLIMLASREETRGAWVDFKKPVLKAMPVLDVSVLSDDQRRELAAAYDAVGNEALHPFPHMADDPVRAKIDGAIARVLDLPDFSVLRTLLAQEPVVCLKRL